MREIQLHDTFSGEVIPLRPRDPGKVGIYACGPTVYGRIHVGNARPFVVFSLLKRFLEHEGYVTTLVVNVTDVNDKIYDAARAQDRPSEALAKEMTERYFADTEALELGRPDHEPLASETMGSIIAYIATLIDTGHAYAADGDVYFHVRSDEGYGSLSHRRLEDMELEARPPEDEDQDEEPGPDSPTAQRKRDPLDFALWKAHKPGEDTSWDSPWGQGRPGWHIECSAMAEEALGVGFEIHGGGSDLVFPHHENEAAQTRAARGQELARIWMHNGMIQFTGEKMAKSVGNIAPLHEVIERYGRDAVVMYLASGHYRQPLQFSESELGEAGRRVQRIRDALRRLDAGKPSPSDMAHLKEAALDALAEDFNTPKALASVFEWVREANRRTTDTGEAGPGHDDGGAAEVIGDGDLREMLDVLGLGGLTPARADGDVATIDPEASRLLELRERARAKRDFEAADHLREELRERGWEIRDGSDGPELIPLAQKL
jgi:cysteinyl-tRNA synthetase